jgi:hypothetical protein
LFRRCGGDETIRPATKPFFACRAELRKPLAFIKPLTKRPTAENQNLGDGQMRSLSFIILAFGFVLAGLSMAGSVDSGLPGVGTFSYNGSPVTVASQPLMIAVR